jgi:parallel beta-helix repeat protein
LRISCHTAGISLDTSYRNTLTTNIATSNEYGISLSSTVTGGYSKDNMLVGNNVSNNTRGISMSHHDRNNSLIDNNASYNAIGIDLRNQCENNTIIDNNVSNNIVGISLWVCSRNTLSGNFVTENSNGVILYSDLFGSNGNLIYNNYFNNTNNAIDGNTGDAYYGNNTWNTSKIISTSIIGGSYLGGNFWANPSGTGFSQTCSDANGDGICDSPYVLDANHVDYLPLTTMKVETPPPPAPELTTIALTGLGVFGLLFVVKKKK